MRTLLELALMVGCILAFACDSAHAQDADFRPRYWTTERKVEVPFFVAALAADSYLTDRNLSTGGSENNAVTGVFTHTRASRVAYFSALSVLTVGGSYWLEKRHHARAAKWLLRLQVGSEIEAATFSGVRLTH